MQKLHKWAAQVDSEMAIFKLFVNVCNRGRFDLRCNSNQGSILAYKQSMDIELRRVQQSVCSRALGQKSLCMIYPQHKFWQAPASIHFAEHAASGVVTHTPGLVGMIWNVYISVYPTLVHVNEVQGIKLLNIRVNTGNLILDIKLHCISFSWEKTCHLVL